MTISLTERFWRKVVKSEQCWLWQGHIAPNGYGMVGVNGRIEYAHRVVYQLAVGPIPEGYQVDHVKTRGCTNRACVNPAHLEAVPARVNNERSDSPTAVNGRKTHCDHGHEFTAANTYVSKKGRACRACRRDRDERRRKAAYRGTTHTQNDPLPATKRIA